MMQASSNPIHNNMEKPSNKQVKKGHGKLKDSCDACAQTKVRCSKEKPVCARCAARSLCCGYSLSQRKGKPRASSTSDSGASSTNLSTIPSTTSSALIPNLFSNDPYEDIFDLSDQQSSSLELPRLKGVSSTRATSSVDSGYESRGIGAIKNGHKTPAEMILETYMAALPDIRYYEPMPHFFWDTSGYDFDYDGLLNFDGLDGCQAWDQNLTDWSLGMQPQPWTTDNITSTPLPFDFASLTQSNMEDNCGDSGDCTARALDMLRQLNIPQSGCNSQVEGKQSSYHPTHDQALALIRRIIDSVHEIIQCTCSKQMLVAHLLTMLLIKVISWYESALPAAASLESQTRTSTSGLCPQISPVVASCSHDMGDGKQRMQVVLTGIGRVHSLVDALSDRFGSCGNILDQEMEAENESKGGEVRVLKHSVLLSELEQIIRQKERRIVDAVVQLLGLGV